MPEKSQWWKTCVIYQIYPRSFQDTNNDGIGDIRGIISRLDYLKDLGIGAIWLSPVYPSPMHDFGYDVSDYKNISPEFGTMDDFTELISHAHRLNIRIIMDLVLNHTSHEHPWFQESASSTDNPKRNWYIWHKGNPGKRPKPPNNWLAAFGGRAWEWDPNTEEFYLHTFLKEQPDVNWRNPDLQNAMWEVIRFWLDMGVDGFRLDVVNWFIKDEKFRNNPKRLKGLRPYDRQCHIYDRNRHETIGIMKQIRDIVDQYPQRMAIGEVFAPPPGDAKLVAAYYDGGKGLHMAFNFAFLYCLWDAGAFSDVVKEYEELLPAECQPNYTLSNHDQKRAFSRYSKGEESIGRAKVAAALLLTLRGPPFIYFGEEIGMKNGNIPKSRLQDPLGKRYWPLHPGRDGERTPMQWDGTDFAGFSRSIPWLPVNSDFKKVNVENQKSDPDSLFNWYKKLIQIRQAEPALHSGDYKRLSSENQVLSYERKTKDETIVVALNFSSKKQSINLTQETSWKVLFGSSEFTPGDVLHATVLPGYGVLILKSIPA